MSLRGGYQHANRAPNTAELFTGPTTTVAGFPLSDPCAITTLRNLGQPAVEPEPRAGAGAVLGNHRLGHLDVRRQDPNDYVGGNGGFFPLELELRRGNLELESEKATTWTAGLVLRSPFEHPAR